MRKAWPIVLTVAFTLPATGCSRWREVHRDAVIVVEERPPFFAPLNVHGGVTRRLTVFGHTYDRVLGFPPCYLTVPEIGGLLFVTATGDTAKNVYHCADPKTKSVVSMPGVSGFGFMIGAPGQRDDYIESASPERIVIVQVGLNGKNLHTLDLRKKALTRTESFSYDASGNVKSHTVRDW